jgi:hypothetical protein
MKKLLVLISVSLLVSCANGKLGRVEQPLEKDSLSKSEVIYIEPISAMETTFSGDKSTEEERLTEERKKIESTYDRQIADALIAKGFNVKVGKAPTKSGKVIAGKVTRFDHGSASGRFWMGAFGVGASKLYTDVKIHDNSTGKTLALFEVIATSGGRGGIIALGSFIDSHLNDGSKKIAQYITELK